jgi:hypothetical protein
VQALSDEAGYDAVQLEVMTEGELVMDAAGNLYGITHSG